MTRRENDRYSKIITEWFPIVMKRKRSRQNTRWSDDIVKMTGKDWSRIVRQRKACQFLGESYAHKSLVSRKPILYNIYFKKKRTIKA